MFQEIRINQRPYRTVPCLLAFGKIPEARRPHSGVYLTPEEEVGLIVIIPEYDLASRN